MGGRIEEWSGILMHEINHREGRKKDRVNGKRKRQNELKKVEGQIEIKQ